MSRRRSIFVTASIDQAEQKLLEESLSTQLHANLRCLSFVQPLPESARQFLQKDVFVKPNKNAFYHIVRHVLMIIDPMECRKKFRWPITTKEDEFEFRNAALVYFNECCGKFDWHFGPFKMQVVLFPGGIEFMKIMVQLTMIAMRATLKRNEPTGKHLTLTQTQHKVKQIEELNGFVTETRMNAEGRITDTEQRTRKLEKLLLNVLLESGAQIDPAEILQGNLIDYWQGIQHRYVDKLMLAFGRVRWVLEQCRRLQCVLAAPENELAVNWKALNKMNVADGSALCTLDYGKLLEYFRANHLRMKQMSKSAEPDLVRMQEQLLILCGVYGRVSAAHQTIGKLDKCDSAIHSMSENGSEQSVDTQYLVALLPTSPAIDCKTSASKPPYRISLTTDFYPVHQLENFSNTFNDGKY